MKKVLPILIITALIFCISACSGGEQGTADNSSIKLISQDQEMYTPNDVEQNQNKDSHPKAEITKQAVQSWKDSIDNVWAHAAIEITNTGDIPIEIGDISIGFVDSDGGILGTASMLLPVPDILMPGDKSYASESVFFETLDSTDQIAGIETNIDYSAVNIQPQLLKITDLKIIPSDFGGPVITGRVVNSSQKNADDIRVAVAMLDEQDNLLGVYSDVLDVTLSPDQRMAFEVSYPQIQTEGFADKVKKMEGKAYNWNFQF